MKPKNSTTLSSTSFLDEVAQHILREEKPSECAVLLPSYRAIGAFRRAYARLATPPCRLPHLFTLSGFIDSESDTVVADEMEVLATFYASELESEGGKEGFDRFLSWAPVALKDFHAIDSHSLNPEQVFKNLEMIKDIEDWSFAPDKELTEDQTRFKNQWSRLESMYRALHERLEKKGLVTKAMQNRKLAEKDLNPRYRKVVAAGLVALTKSEKQYLKKWDKAERLDVLWDADSAYVDNHLCEAGHFIRDFERVVEVGGAKMYSRLAESQPEIVSVECSSVMSSCQYIREQVMNLSEDEKHKTVIVVPDPTSLPVLMQALPAKADKKDGYNVTMGMSIRETPVYSFLKLINRMALKGGESWNYEDLLSFASHSVSIEAFGGEKFSKDAGEVIHMLAQNYVVWARPEKIAEFSNGKMSRVIETLMPLKQKGADEFIGAYVSWANMVGEKLAEVKCTDPWINAGWEKVRGVLATVRRLQENHKLCKTTKEIVALVDRLISREKIDLIGEPAKGLQIMGLTETRAVDFDNVIVLDCNEGLVPKHEITDSFIPFDLQSNLGMPGRFEKEAAFAYSFYRLLNRSKKVTLLHRSPNSSRDASEVSRYIIQLMNSFRPGGRLLEIKHGKFSMPLPNKTPEIPRLEMTQKMRDDLDKWVKAGMSPSAINKMVACERNFAYRYLFGLSEPQDLKESIESNTLGSIIHEVIEKGTEPFLNQILRADDLRTVLKGMKQLLDDAIAENYNETQVESGENVLIIDAARLTIRKLIEQEIKEIESGSEVVINAVEEDLLTEFDTEIGTIVLKGQADRIETVGGVKRIVDYKSGNVQQHELNLNADFEEQLNNSKKSKALQLLIYGAILLQNEEVDGIEAGIRSGRNTKKGILKLSIGKNPTISQVEVDKMLEWLTNQISSLKNEGHELEHNPDSKYCEYCVSLDPKKKAF